jgi:holo-[acyl-carrier protein] synthase
MIDGIALTDIEILQDQTGRPFVEIKNGVDEAAKHRGIVSWNISVSHSNNSSIAFVTAECFLRVS